MANIEIYNLPDSGTVDDADFLHIAQNDADKKITIGDLADNFGEVDIYGMTEITNPGGGYWFALAYPTGDIDLNRKVSIDNISAVLQADTYYSDLSSVSLTDDIVFRSADGSSLNQITVQKVRDKVLDGGDGFTALGTRGAAADKMFIYDASATTAKTITVPWLRQSMLETTNLTALTTMASGDMLPVWDISATTAKKISYSSLEAQIEAAISPSSYAKLASANTFTDVNTFIDSSGVTTDKISTNSSTTLSIAHTTISAASEITAVTIDATNLEGAFLGDRGNTSYYINSATADITSGRGTSYDEDSANIFRATCDGLLPNDNAGTFLGDKSKPWKEVHGDRYYGDYITAAYTMYANNIYLRGSSSNSYSPLLDYDDGDYFVDLDYIRRAGTGYESGVGYAYGSCMLASSSSIGPTYRQGDAESTDPKNVLNLDNMYRAQTRINDHYLGFQTATNSSGNNQTFYFYLTANTISMGDVYQQIVGNIVSKTGTSTSSATIASNWEQIVDINSLFDMYLGSSEQWEKVSIQTSPLCSQGYTFYDPTYSSFDYRQSYIRFGIKGYYSVNSPIGLSFTITYMT